MQRRAIIVEGIVQGVGFRPFVYGLALRAGLRGFVRNTGGAVRIEAEGDAVALDELIEELQRRPPPLASVQTVRWNLLPLRGDREFHIAPSDGDELGPVFVAPDVATCPDCLRELFDASDRRYRYPFLNCTNCGPRLTIVTGAPYDRRHTTMARFAMCPACRSEYDDPCNRRYHAQPTACPTCGPQLWLTNAAGERVASDDPLLDFAAALVAGKIGAMKGLGGYHLVCDARNEATVAALRTRKGREEKPLAVMVGDLAAAAALCETDAVERALLASPRRPIVLLRKRNVAAPSGGVAEAVAPRNPCLGVMLPYTPLHWLLFDALPGAVLVMTSGNRSAEPIAYEDRDAAERLRGIAEVFLTHDRPIRVRCDDSVSRVVSGSELPLRRSRGYAPQPIRLPMSCTPAILAVGGQLKNTFALAQGDRAILSHHLGDLDHYEAYRAFENDILLYEQLFSLCPEWIAHDLHPDYASTRYAHLRGLPRVAVQHHHAHFAACMAENGLTQRLMGVAFDGAGLGTDGAIWGGEFLVGDYSSFHRAAHFRYVPMPGGERVVREPWRMAVAYLRDAGCDCAMLTQAVPARSLQIVEAMLERRFHAPLTSSVGRLFDAVAAIAGLRTCASFEGQAAMELEAAASRAACDDGYPFDVIEPGADRRGAFPGEPLPSMVVDMRPLIRSVADDVRRRTSIGVIARRFHAALTSSIAEVCRRIRRQSGLDAVALSGGVFANALLAEEVAARLTQDGFRVFRHRLTPPNDGSLSLGQAAVAARRIALELQPDETRWPCVLESPAVSSKRTASETC